jgi:hypothetical protein
MPSCSELLTARKNRVLAVSTVDRKNASCSVQLSREAGELGLIPYKTNKVTGLGPDGNPNDSQTITWDSVLGATSYTVELIPGDGNTIVTTPVFPQTTTNTSFSFVYDSWSGPYTYGDTIRVTANPQCCVTGSTITVFPCFLAGSLVHTADGVKAIEDVQVGDIVVGAFGELNEVLALHRPLLGSAKMCRINDEHSTTNHHPHVSLDKKFYCGDPDLVSSSTYGHMHTVLDAEGKSVQRMLHGLKKERIRKLELGVELKTIEGSRTTNSVEVYEMPADTQLYNLVVSGSHTYHVDGYAVTGWPAEHDFDYDTWTVVSSV